MRFRGIPWGSMRFYNVPVNQSVPTEANRSLTSYIFVGHLPSEWTNNELGIAWLEQVFDKKTEKKARGR
jgi:hypothetical protein